MYLDILAFACPGHAYANSADDSTTERCVHCYLVTVSDLPEVEADYAVRLLMVNERPPWMRLSPSVVDGNIVVHTSPPAPVWQVDRYVTHRLGNSFPALDIQPNPDLTGLAP